MVSIADVKLLPANISRIWKKLFSSEAERPKANKAICNLMIVSIFLCCIQATWQAFGNGGLMGTLSASVYDSGVATVVNIVLIELTTMAMFLLVRYDRQGYFTMARYVCRVLLILLIASFLSCLSINGLIWVEAFYIFQFLCVVSYQVANDPNLSDNAPWSNPIRNPFKKKETEEGIIDREKYIPLNVFNLFWVFVVASFAGILIETWYHLVVFGEWEDRAGLMWGPFSPIYGFGAVLMTIALNRFWNKSSIMIFLVAAFIGASFEFFTSWYMETAFGILAWDYSGTFLNIDGRTNFAFFCAWGVLGLLWVKILLPVTMRIVDAVKPQWRAALTMAGFTFMVVDACFTLLALDCWSLRTAGNQPSNDVQVFFAENFDDQVMEDRFQTMSVVHEGTLRSGE